MIDENVNTKPFDAEDVLGHLSGVELKKVAKWLKENNYWNASQAPRLSEAEEAFFMDLHKIGENFANVNDVQLHTLRGIAKTLG